MNRSVQSPTPAAFVMLQDGRRMSFAEYGRAGGRPLVVLHGTPGGRLHAQVLDAAARDAGVRIIAPDRPGFGYSDPWPLIDFVSYADDLRQLLDDLHITRTAFTGVSGGGAFALGAAKAIPGRISQVILMCGMAPAPRELRKAMPRQSRLLFFLAARAPWLAAALMRRAYVGDPESPALRRTISALPAADRRVLERADVRELLWGGANRDSLRQGLGAAIRELALYSRPIGFDLRDIAIPVQIIHGSEDRNVPIDVARYIAAQIPDARLEIVPDAGHMFLFESPELAVAKV